jgi:hypothetical protein
MSRSDRKILASLERAHRLGFRQRRLCRRLAALYGLDGSAPETSPAMLFFRPSWWDLFLRDARSSAELRLRPEAIEGLRDILFGSRPTAAAQG